YEDKIVDAENDLERGECGERHQTVGGEKGGHGVRVLSQTAGVSQASRRSSTLRTRMAGSTRCCTTPADNGPRNTTRTATTGPGPTRCTSRTAAPTDSPSTRPASNVPEPRSPLAAPPGPTRCPAGGCGVAAPGIAG